MWTLTVVSLGIKIGLQDQGIRNDRVMQGYSIQALTTKEPEDYSNMLDIY